MSASNLLEDALLNHSLRYGTDPFVASSQLYLALFTSPDSAGGTLEDLEQGILTNEVSGNGYSRQAISFGSASGGQSQGPTGSAVTFTASGGSFGTITHIAVVADDGTGDSAGGTPVYYAGSLQTSKQVDDGDSLQFAVNSITITMS